MEVIIIKKEGVKIKLNQSKQLMAEVNVKVDGHMQGILVFLVWYFSIGIQLLQEN